MAAEVADVEKEKKDDFEYYESVLNAIRADLSKKRRCGRCEIEYTELQSLGRLQCSYHEAAAESSQNCARCGPITPAANNGRGGCISIDHGVAAPPHNCTAATNLYTTYPLSVWRDIDELHARLGTGTRYRRRGVWGGPMQCVTVTSVDEAFSSGVRVEFVGVAEPLTIAFHTAYDECAARNNYASLDVVPDSRAAEERARAKRRRGAAEIRPMGDSSDVSLAHQRRLFDLDTIDSLAVDTPAFIPFVVIVRVETLNIKKVRLIN
jgi:hypothetical protein